MKKLWIFVVSALMVVVSVFSVVGCQTDKNVLNNYLLPESDGRLLEEDFTLPSSINGNEVSWSSNKTGSISVSKGNDQYNAAVTLGDEVETVKLTVSHGKESKQFDVKVRALDVSYFVEKFKFEKDKEVVYEDFELPGQTEDYNGNHATITWSNDDNSDYIDITKEGGKDVCKVTQSTVDREVKIYATFSYKDQTQKPNYRMTVSYERTHGELSDYWYYNTGVSVKMSGYIVAIATAYSDSYNNVNLYMVDDDYCTGYYLYRVKLDDKSQGSLLVPGAHVTVTGTINTNYNGLIETNAGGSLVVDTDKSITKEALYEHVYAIDDDVLAGSREAVYHTSTLVSLSNWKVTEKASKAPGTNATSTLFTLQKGDVKVAVAISKYMEGVYATSTGDATFDALCALYNSVNVGDVVNVEGILGNYNGYQIMPLSADKVTVVTDETEKAKADVVPAECTAINAAIDKVQGIFEEAGITSTSADQYGNYKKNSGYTVVASKTVNAPVTEGSVTIKYELLHKSGSVANSVYSDADAETNGAYALIENGAIVITVGDEDMACIRVTYTCGTYSTCTYNSVYTKQMTPAQIVSNIQYSYKLATTETAIDDVELDTTYAQYPGSAISWAIEGTVEGVEIVNGNTLHVSTPNTAEDKVIKLVATFTYGEGQEQKTATKKFDFTLKKVTAVETGTYKFAMELTGNKVYYFTGAKDGYYGATSESYFDAVDVVIEEATGGYIFKVGAKYLELEDTSYANLTLLDAATTGVWKYDYSLNVFTWTNSFGTYYMGTYGTRTTIGASKISYIQDTTVIGVTQFVVKPVKAVEYTDEEKADLALNSLTIPASVTGNLALTTTVPGVTLSIKASTNPAAIALDGTVTRGSEDVTGITLTIAASIDSKEVKTKDFANITVPKVVNGTGEPASLSFAFDDGKNDSISADQGVWKDGDLTVTVDKGTGSDVNNGDYYKAGNDHVRCYQGANVTIAYTGITKVVFHYTAANYGGNDDNLKASLGTAYATGATITVDTTNKTVTIVFTEAKNEVKFTCAKQARLTSIDINPAN